jgi:hypothetical protein
MQLDNFDMHTSSTLLIALIKKPVGNDLLRLVFLQDLDRDGYKLHLCNTQASSRSPLWLRNPFTWRATGDNVPSRSSLNSQVPV